MSFLSRFESASGSGLRRTSALALVFLVLAAGAGCQSTPSGSSAPPAQQAVLLTTGNGTTSVVLPKSDGGVTYLSSAKTDHCPQCESDIGTYFKTGQLAQKCSVCGATRTTLTGTN